MYQGLQCESIEANAKIAGDTDQKQGNRAVFSGESGKNQRAEEGDHLRSQQKNNLPYRIQIQIGAYIDAVVNDGSDSIDVQKESDQKEQDLFIGPGDFFQRPKDRSEGLCQCMTFGFFC